MAEASAGGSVCPRTEPEIYVTNDGRTIVEDELLSFISVKMRTLTQDEIVVLVTSNFSSEWIENATRLLFDVCPKTSQRYIKHKGIQKDANNVKSCLKQLKECGQNTPRFVSYFLDALPPVGFGHMDTSALLGRMERLNQEVADLRRTMETQASLNQNLGAVATALDRRIAAIEQRTGSEEPEATAATDVDRRIPANENRADSDGSEATTAAIEHRITAIEERMLGMNLQAAADTAPEVQVGTGPACQEEIGLLNTATSTGCHTQPQTPHGLQWNTVVRDGKKKTPRNAAAQSKHRVNQAHSKRELKKTGITGTGTNSNIQVVTSKLVSVFATRFAPSLEADALCDYLKEKLNNTTVTCRRIESTNSRFGSFHVTSECDNVDVMYKPELWPAGTYVRRYYEARGTNATGTSKSTAATVQSASV